MNGQKEIAKIRKVIWKTGLKIGYNRNISGLERGMIMMLINSRS